MKKIGLILCLLSTCAAAPMRDVLALTNQRLYAVGAEGEIRHSADGGQSWTKKTIPLPMFRGFRAIAGDSRVLFAAGDDETLYRSRDQGRTWHSLMKLDPVRDAQRTGHKTYADFQSLSYKAGVLLVLANVTVVMRSTDQGATFERIYIPHSSGRIFADDNGLVMIPWDSHVLRSTNAGKTFSEVEVTKESDSLLQIVEGEAGKLYGFGGVSWIVDYSSARYGHSSEVTMFQSSDRGLTWKRTRLTNNGDKLFDEALHSSMASGLIDGVMTLVAYDTLYKIKGTEVKRFPVSKPVAFIAANTLWTEALEASRDGLTWRTN